MNSCLYIKNDNVRCRRKVTNLYCNQHQKIINRKYSQSGGNGLLSAGTYGCVYYPPLECTQRPDLNHKFRDGVMKLANPCEEGRFDEDEISLYVKMLDPVSQYFVPLSGDFCSIKTESGPNVAKLRQCEGYINSSAKHKYRGYFIDHGGDILHNYYQKHRITVNLVWKWIQHCLEGLSLLHSVGIVHGDIKNNNIVIKDEVPRLIDFGLSFFANEHITPRIGYYSLYPLFYSVMSVTQVNSLYDNYEEAVKYFYPNYQKNTPNDIILYYFNASRSSLYFNNMVKPNLFKIDLYMLFDTFRSTLWIPNEKQFKAENSLLSSAIIELINKNTSLFIDEAYDMKQNFAFVNSVNNELKKF